MRTILIKLLHDLARAKGKFLLCVIAASLSAWGISGVFYSYLMSERDFKVNFSATNPADIILKIENNNTALLQKLSANPNVASLERREVLNGRVKNSNDRWMPVLIHLTESFDDLRVNKFKVLETFDAAENTIFIEKNGSDFLDLSSDSVTIQFSGQDTAYFKKGGYIQDAGLPPSRMERMVYAYAPIAAFKERLNPTTQRFLIKTKERQPTGAKLQVIGNELKAIIEQNNGKLIAISIPPPGEHPHQNIVNGIAFLQQTFGFVLALLGVALLSLILLTWLFPQLPQIGIMKAVGAFTQRIFWSYFIILLLIICLGLLIGMPLGYITAQFYNNFIAFIQNFEPVKDMLPVITHIPVILTATLIPLLFCIIPLRQVSKTSVRSALSKTFHTPQKAIFIYSQRLISISRFKYSFHNIFRNTQNTGLLILILTVGIGLFFTGANLKYSINKDLQQYFQASRYQLTCYLSDSTQQPTDFLDALPFVESVAVGKRSSIAFQAPAKDYLENGTLQTFSKAYQFSPTLLLSGKLNTDCKDCIFINNMHGRNFKNFKVGERLPIITLEKDTLIYTFAGIIKELAASPGFYIFSNQDIPSYDELFIRLKEGYSSSEAGSKIEEALQARGIKVTQMVEMSQRLAALEAHLAPTFLIIQVMGIFTILIGLIGILIVLSLTIEERTNEIGILKAVGSSTFKIIQLLYNEFLIINGIAIMMSILATLLLTPFLCNLFGNMLLGTSFGSFINIGIILATIGILLLLETLMIIGFSRLKIRKNTRLLLG